MLDGIHKIHLIGIGGSGMRAIANILIQKGYDTRISGSMLESALAAGICSVGGNVVIAGIIPTPAVAYTGGRVWRYV